MGVIKNEVGRPSNKTKKIRMVLKLIGVLVVITLAVFLGYYIKDNEKKIVNNKIDNNESNNNSIKELDINSDLVVNLFNKYNLYTNWLNIYTNEEIDREYYKNNLEKINISFSYFYDNKSIKNVDDFMKFAVSVGNLYIKEETLISDGGETYKHRFIPFDYDNGKTVSFDVINEKSMELFGSEIDINNIIDNKNNIIVSILDTCFKYDSKSNTIKFIASGIGDASSIDYYTKIISAEEYSDKIIITNKVMFIACSAEDNFCYVSKTDQDINNIKDTIDEVSCVLKESETSELSETSKLIDKYYDKLDTYKWIFTKNDDGTYTFSSVERF